MYHRRVPVEYAVHDGIPKAGQGKIFSTIAEPARDTNHLQKTGRQTGQRMGQCMGPQNPSCRKAPGSRLHCIILIHLPAQYFLERS